MKITMLVGAHAYACIDENGRKTDILLSPGKSAQQSLREYAESERARALRILSMAEIAERAADHIDSNGYGAA